MKKVLVTIVSSNNNQRIVEDMFECNNTVDAVRVVLTYECKRGYEVVQVMMDYVEGLV